MIILVRASSAYLRLMINFEGMFTKNHSLMQFLLVAYDGTDPRALERRMKIRPEHLEKVAVLKKQGNFLFGGAILDDKQTMIGSMIVTNSPTGRLLTNT